MKTKQKNFDKTIKDLIKSEVENLPFIMESMQPSDRANFLLKLMQYDWEHLTAWDDWGNP